MISVGCSPLHRLRTPSIRTSCRKAGHIRCASAVPAGAVCWRTLMTSNGVVSTEVTTAPTLAEIAWSAAELDATAAALGIRRGRTLASIGRHYADTSEVVSEARSARLSARKITEHLSRVNIYSSSDADRAGGGAGGSDRDHRRGPTRRGGLGLGG